MVGGLPLFPDGPILRRKFKNPLRDRRQTVQVGILVLSLVKNAIVEVGLTSEVRNTCARSIMVVGDREHFLMARLEFCRDHGSNSSREVVNCRNHAFLLTTGQKVGFLQAG